MHLNLTERNSTLLHVGYLSGFGSLSSVDVTQNSKRVLLLEDDGVKSLIAQVGDDRSAAQAQARV